MEKHLQKLVEYAQPKKTSFLCVSGNKSEIKTTYSPPLELPISPNGYEMALVSLETYYSFPNINATNNHVSLSFDDGISWTDVYLPIGCYEIHTINSELQKLIMSQTHDDKSEKRLVLSADTITLHSVLEIVDKKCKINFNVDNSLQSVLGFDKKIYAYGQRHESENIVNILSVNTIFVHCDVIESSRLNGVEAPIIHTFFPNAVPGEKVVYHAKHLIYIPLTSDIISHMSCWITDQSGKLLDLQGEEITITFYIKAK